MPPSNLTRSDRESLETESRMLPQDPPPFVLRAAAWILIALFFSALLASILIRIPESFSCPCVLAPEGGSDPIQSPRLAVVQEVRVHEGQAVAAGAELYVLSSEEVRDWDTQRRTVSEDLRSREFSLEKADAAAAAEMAIMDQEVAQAEDEVKFRTTYLETIRNLVGRLEKLAAIGSISQVEIITHRLELAGADKELSVGRKNLQATCLQRQQMATEQTRKHSDALAEIEKFKLRLTALKSQLADSAEARFSIRAPYDAVVISLAQRNAGTVVQNGQELCQLARPNGRLVARLQIKEPALPRVSVGQRIRFFADAFPYQRYGSLTGKLDWISPSAVSSPEGLQFVALASLDQNAFQINGQTRPLQVGMKGEAHVIVGSRSLIESALEPLRQLRENLRY